MTWNSYARFAGDVIDFQNRTAFIVLELYTIANQTAGTVEALRVRAIEFARDLHASEVRRARELDTLSFEVKMEFSIAEQRSTLSNALVGILHLSQTEQQAWQKYVQWHTAAGQCVTDRCEHLTSLIYIDAGILMTTGDNQPPPIIEKWLLNEVVVIGFDAQYNQMAEVLTLCSIPYSLKRGCNNGQCKECLEIEAWCARGRIECNLVVIAKLCATPCQGRQDTAEWILIPTAKTSYCLTVDTQGALMLHSTEYLRYRGQQVLALLE